MLEPWRWIRQQELDGEWITSIAEAKDGGMWFRTRLGVVRYDGSACKRFTTREGLLDNEVDVVYATRDGSVYAGTESGLCRFSEGKWQTLWPASTTNRFRILCLTEARDGSLWGGTAFGLARWSNGSITFFTSETNQTRLTTSAPSARFVFPPKGKRLDGEVYAVMEDRDHAIWAATPESILKLNEEPAALGSYSWQSFTKQEGLMLGDHLSQIYQATNGEIWTIDDSGNSGINRFDGKSWTTVRLSQQFGGDDIYNSIWQTSDGKIWISGFGRLFAWDAGQWRCYPAGELPLEKDRVCLRQSSRGDFWIAGRDGKTWRVEYSGPHWLTYPGLHFHAESADGQLWYITSEGRVVVQNPNSKEWLQFGPEDGLIDSASSLIVIRNGEVWAGGSHDGIPATAKFDGTQWHRRQHPELTYPIGYRSMFQAADDSLWFGCEPGPWLQGNRGGLLRYRRNPTGQEEWTHFGPAQNVNFFCVGFAQTGDGMLWTGGSGFTGFDGTQPHIPRIPDELRDRWIDNVCLSPNDRVWLAVGGLGAYSLTGTNWRKFSTEDGLADSMVSCILPLKDGTVLAGTASGISRFDSKRWTPFALPPSLRIEREGGTLRQAADGSIWINLASRAWYQRDISKAPLTPPEVLGFKTIRYQSLDQSPSTKFRIFPSEVSQPGNVFLSWEGTDPWQETAPEDLEYSFRLNQDDWSPFTAARSHYYLTMKSGRHKFQVRARDRDFNVETKPAEVDFTVLPPVWQQAWFLALIFVGIGSIAVLQAQLIQRNRRILVDSTQLSQINHRLSREVEERNRTQVQLEEKTKKLESEIEERGRIQAEKDRIYKELLVASRRAGMADVATNVIHNVGNVLNSVTVSIGLISSWARAPRELLIRKLSLLLRQHEHDLPAFITEDTRGREIPNFLEKFAHRLAKDRTRLLEEIEGLCQNVDHIKAIVALQQEYAQVAGVQETISLAEVVEDALRFQFGNRERKGIQIDRELTDNKPLTLDRHKLVLILVNLLSHAEHSCWLSATADKRICVRIVPGTASTVKVIVAHNGLGIEPSKLTRIFSGDFILHQNTQGLSLHTSALAAKELGGSLRAQSEGVGKGAEFVLELPFSTPTA